MMDFINTTFKNKIVSILINDGCMIYENAAHHLSVCHKWLYDHNVADNFDKAVSFPYNI